MTLSFKIVTYPEVPSSISNFKRFLVTAPVNHDLVERMMDVVDSLGLKYGYDYVLAGSTLYFDTDEYRTMFLLSFDMHI